MKYVKRCKKTAFRGKKNENPFEFGKFMSYFAYCLVRGRIMPQWLADKEDMRSN